MKKIFIPLIICIVIFGLGLAGFFIYASFVVSSSDILAQQAQIHIMEQEASEVFAHIPQNTELIPFNFYAFRQPDFNSEIIGSFVSQEVNIIRRVNDWVLAGNREDSFWVYTKMPLYTTSRVYGLFDNKGDIEYNYIIECSQLVPIVQEEGSWLEIITPIGNMWLDRNFTPSTTHLEELLAPFSDDIAVLYKNINTGFTFTLNGDRQYFAASVTKAPYVLWIYKLLEQGLFDINTLIEFRESDYWPGSGRIRHIYAFGDMLTRRRLLEVTITVSDNVSTRMLRRVHGLEGFREFLTSIGADPHFAQNVSYSYISANEAGIWAMAIFDYIESDGIYAETFKHHLKTQRYPFITSENYDVASKTGWAANFGGAWHDMAIVYADSPYILVLLSNWEGTWRNRLVYNEIALAFEEFNRRYFR